MLTSKNKTGTAEIPSPAANENNAATYGLSEDVWAVIMGGSVIVVILLITWITKGFTFGLPVYKWADSAELVKKVFAFNNVLFLLGCGVAFAFISSVAVYFSGGRVTRYLPGFVIIFLAAISALIMAGFKTMNSYGIEYVVFALIIGLLIGNLTRVPSWLKEAARSEFFIKTGLVILGTSVLFTDIIQAGVPGILQSIVVVAVVWFFSLWLSRRLKVDDEFGVILASAVSICGVSAAIVASGAIKGDKKKLSYITTLVLLVAIPMLIIQPWLIRKFGIPELVGGAWLGGTLDTTASVTAAAQLVGPLALKAGVIVKFSQNVLIGVAAFFIAAWWAIKKDPSGAASSEGKGLGIVWERFPKFVLGFIAVSLIFSFLIPSATIKEVSGILNSLRTLWFALAFVAIGIEANFSDLVSMEGGRPAVAFITAQIFNILWTLLWAYLLFGGVLLPVPEIR